MLYLTDPVDEAMVQSLQKFGEFELTDVSKEGLNLGEDAEEKEKAEKVSGPLGGVCGALMVVVL